MRACHVRRLAVDEKARQTRAKSAGSAGSQQPLAAGADHAPLSPQLHLGPCAADAGLRPDSRSSRHEEATAERCCQSRRPRQQHAGCSACSAGSLRPPRRGRPAPPPAHGAGCTSAQRRQANKHDAAPSPASHLPGSSEHPLGYRPSRRAERAGPRCRLARRGVCSARLDSLRQVSRSLGRLLEQRTREISSCCCTRALAKARASDRLGECFEAAKTSTSAELRRSCKISSQDEESCSSVRTGSSCSLLCCMSWTVCHLMGSPAHPYVASNPHHPRAQDRDWMIC